MVWVLPEIVPEVRIKASSSSLLESEGNAGGRGGCREVGQGRRGSP